MKTLTSKFSVTMKDSNDENRTFRVGTDESQWIIIGSGPNTQDPKIKVHPDDIENFIKAVKLVATTKLPNEL